ncbi:MAG: hypothetical protein NTV68_06115, partial [Methanomicrobiales archaeon]|nr:hypothetical protein [Methanomicrobiales archaeon]
MPDCGDPTGAKPLPVPAKTRSAPKMGSAKSGVARGYRLTFAMTGLGWRSVIQNKDPTMDEDIVI